MGDFAHVLIRASAGTGKTFQLSNRYLGLLRAGVSPDQILATTFTRKAAGEILDRVMIRLATAALDEEERRRLADHLGAESLSQEQCHEMLGCLVRHLHRLRICTLDAFFAQLAGSFSLELGLPPGWRITEQLHDQQLRTQAIGATLRGQQKQEVTRLVHLMAKGEARRSIGDLLRSTVNDLYSLYTATDEAAWHCLPQPRPLGGEPLAAAIESLGNASLPNDKRFSKARDKDLEAARNQDWEPFISSGLAAKVLDGVTVYYKKDIPDETVTIYRRLITHARAVLLDQMAKQTAATYELLDKFHTAYTQLKRQARAIRFEDVTRCLAASRERDQIDRQHYRLDTRLAHLLLDEFQDTSLGQWQVIRPLALHVTARPPASLPSRHTASSSFFCVGDVKQAIYGWRGGSAEIFDALEVELHDLAKESLDESHRSSQPVIDAVNRAFENMGNHPNLERYDPAVREWCSRFTHHTTAKGDLPGYAELRSTPADDNSEQDDDQAISFAAERIKQLVAQAPGCSIGVLVRTNQTVAQVIYELRARHVPASEEGGNPLTDSPAVQLILSLIKLADHPGDTVARFHLATSPLGPHVGLDDARNSASAVQLARDTRSELVAQGYGASVLRWVRLLQPACDRRDRSRLEQLVEMAYRYDSMATLRPADFLRFVESQRVSDPTTAEVRVMTVHQAKGLQFDVVVLPDLGRRLLGQPGSCVVGQPSPTEPINRVCLYRNERIQKLLPDEFQQMFEAATRQSVFEALCVLYVALTRAVHALYMIVPPSTKSEKNPPKTPAGLLRAALAEPGRLEPGTVAYQTGDPAWFNKIARQPARMESVEEPWPHTAIRLAPPLAGSQLEPTSPSKLEGGSRVSGSRVLDLCGTAAAERGTLIHALFEQIEWLDRGSPDEGTLRRVAEVLATDRLDVDQQLSEFGQMLELPAVAEVLNTSFYQPPRAASLARVLPGVLESARLRTEAHNERRFVVRDAGRLMSGSIDRLVLLYEGDTLVGADIIDYKTDAVSESGDRTLDKLVEYYRPQIEAYRRAVSRMFRLGQDRIAARLLFVSVGAMREAAAEDG